ncbi:MAG: hypothetical protein H6721_07500 [Sandaracinus sp.]|nr:hypothetical protein [Sandaracinus sp.]
MLNTPFLTALDSRAAVKGSRDPLGVQPIWTRFGREVIGNLTTVTTSLADFVVMMLGHYFAEEVGGASKLSTFLKWEQICGYARALAPRADGVFVSFRGTDRVRARLAEGRKVTVSADADAQILGDQKTYGLWGLYTAASRASGLIEGDPGGLSDASRDLVERVYLPRLASVAGHGAKALVARLARSEFVLDTSGRDGPLLEVVAELLLGSRTAEERTFFDARLVRGELADVSARQSVLATLLEETLHESDWRLSPRSVRALADHAARRADGEALAIRLERLRTCELLLAPSVALFEHVLGCDGRSPDEVSTQLHDHWGTGLRSTLDADAVATLQGELAPGEPDVGARWCLVARALAEGDYAAAIAGVLEQNAEVMRARGGAAAWVEVRRGCFEVHYRDERLADLPQASELPLYWRHAYFLEALREITRAVRSSS